MGVSHPEEEIKKSEPAMNMALVRRENNLVGIWENFFIFVAKLQS